MLRQKGKCFQPRTLSLEELVPPNHFYRKLEAHLDLRFVKDDGRKTNSLELGVPRHAVVEDDFEGV